MAALNMIALSGRGPSHDMSVYLLGSAVQGEARWEPVGEWSEAPAYAPGLPRGPWTRFRITYRPTKPAGNSTPLEQPGSSSSEE